MESIPGYDLWKLQGPPEDPEYFIECDCGEEIDIGGGATCDCGREFDAPEPEEEEYERD